MEDAAPVPNSASVAPLLQYASAWHDCSLQFWNSSTSGGLEDIAQGAPFVYSRAYSEVPRVAPFSIELRVLDADRAELQHKHQESLSSLLGDIYLWRPEAWKLALEGSADADQTLKAKSDEYWESLALRLAERIFGEEISPAVLLYGPQSDMRQLEHMIPEANLVYVCTHVDGCRDATRPVSRHLYYVASKKSLRRPEVIMRVDVPHALCISGPHAGRKIDYIPSVEGRCIERIAIFVHMPSGTRDRTSKFDFVDYNRIFVPLRHLVFEGMNYSSLDLLAAAFVEVIGTLWQAEDAQGVAQVLRGFMTPENHFTEANLPAWTDRLLGSIAGGLVPDVSRVELYVNDALVGCARSPQSEAEGC